MNQTILVVEDDHMQRKMISSLLEKKLGMRVIEAASSHIALGILADESKPPIDLILADYLMPETDGMELLQIVKQQYPDMPFIMLTGNSSVKAAVDAMRLGADDFLIKPPEPERLRISIQNALKIHLLEKEVNRIKRQETGTVTFSGLIGHDSGLANIIKVGKKAAASDIPVLMLGETGTGKEVFARAIHGESARVGKPFVAVNCGAIPEHLVESTLFGHEKGAFTGAIKKTIGRFREADGGTIFLDEVGDLPLDAQVKLLRVLQQKEVVPVGDGKPVKVNVRILSATHRDLEKDVASGKFRDDLYFRLNVLPIHAPALRDRRSDIPSLVRHFVERFCVSEKCTIKGITDEAIELLACRDWPGNVRELENILHRAVVLSDKEILDRDDFDLTIQQKKISSGAPSLIIKTMKEIEQDAIDHALKITNGNISRAAELLGIAKSTFYRKMKEVE